MTPEEIDSWTRGASKKMPTSAEIADAFAKRDKERLGQLANAGIKRVKFIGSVTMTNALSVLRCWEKLFRRAQSLISRHKDAPASLGAGASLSLLYSLAINYNPRRFPHVLYCSH